MFGKTRSLGLGSVGWGGGSVGDWLRGLVGLNIVSLLGVSVVDLLAHLLGEGQLNGLAVRGGELGDALLDGGDVLLDLGDGDTLLLGQILTGDSGQVDGLLDASLDGLGVGDSDGWVGLSHDGAVVAGLLSDLLAVVVAVAVVTISRGGLADSHHLGVADPLEGDDNGLGGRVLGLLGVGVGADLVLDNLDADFADGSGDGVAHLTVDDLLDGELDWVADGLESWGTDLDGLNDILN